MTFIVSQQTGLYITMKNDEKYPILAQNGQIRFFSKNRALSLFKLDNFRHSCKKSENSYDPTSRKAPDKRTYVRTYAHIQTYAHMVYH